MPGRALRKHEQRGGGRSGGELSPWRYTQSDGEGVFEGKDRNDNGPRGSNSSQSSSGATHMGNSRMQLITWNVQWCKDFDVLCLQEVARNFPALEGSRGEDQFRLLAEALPGYTLIEGIAVDRGPSLAGHESGMVQGRSPARRQFGNAILTRWPVLQVFRHLLPWPADADVSSMQRVAVEVVLAAPKGPLRVTTTHLEYYSHRQRMAQVERLRELHIEAAAHAHDKTRGEKAGGPFEAAPRPVSGLLTGDFNFRPGAPEHARLVARPGGDVPGYVD